VRCQQAPVGTVLLVTHRPAQRRTFVHARDGETVAQIAARELPRTEHAEELLLSWNLHLVVRRSPTGSAQELLGTDIVYLEPPLP
jgi:hypothetical protein